MKTFLFGGISLVAAGWALLALLEANMMQALSMHAMGCAAGILAARAVQPARVPCGWYETTWASLVPCIGGVLAWLHPLSAAYAKSEDVADEYAHYLNAEERLGEHRRSALESDTYRPDPDHLEAMADILRSEASISDKRLAIEALAQMETPYAVQVLRSALTSSSTEVRFYAASILSNLEERLGKRLAALEGDVTQGRRSDPEVELQLARCYFDYAYYGLAEGSRCADYLQQALAHVERYAARTITTTGLLQHGRILLSLGLYEEAEAIFTRAVEMDSTHQSAYLWRAEARFYQNDFAGVRLDTQLAASCGAIPERLAPAVSVWT